MNAKITLSTLGSLVLCSCSPSLTESIAKAVGESLPLGNHLVYGISEVSNDLNDVCVGVSAPREDELTDTQIVFLGTLEENGKNYQIRDVISFQHNHIFRTSGGINRMNKAPEVRKQGVLPMHAYTLNDIGTFNCYERIGGATAVFKERKDSKEGERYTLTFASRKAGTYIYENKVNGVLVGKGEGTFDVENLDD